MRIQPWMTAVASMMMLLTAGTPTSGQTPYPSGPSAVGPEGAYYYQRSEPGGGMVYQPPYGNHDPQAIWPPHTPMDFQPWPQISPYHQPNVAMDQHYNKNGIWFRKLFNRNREYFGSIEVISTWYRDAGNATIGSPYAPIAVWDDQFPLGAPVNVNNLDVPDVTNFTLTVPGFYSVDQQVFPYPLLVSGATPLVQMGAGRFAIRSASNIGGPGSEAGIQGRWGFTNEDKTGLMVTGFWGFEGSGHFSRGDEFINGVRVNQALTTSLAGQNLSAILGHIPLYNGETLPQLVAFGPGSTAKYDVLYSLKHTTQAGGANFSVYQQPLFNSGNVTVKPLWGLRYLYIEEGFQFRGIDSGFSYNVADGAGAGTFRPTGALTLRYNQYEANLRNRVQSQIAGPEIGIRFDLGDSRDSFKIWGETIVGLAANYNEIDLSGNNIGDPLIDARFINVNDPRMLRPGTDASFSDSNSSMHVSPLFQQSIFANIGLFDVLPITRKMSLLEGASFRIGYTFLMVGQVARPTDSIRWQGFPLFPEIDTDRKNWWMHQASFAIDWTF